MKITISLDDLTLDELDILVERKESLLKEMPFAPHKVTKSEIIRDAIHTCYDIGLTNISSVKQF